MGTDLEQFDLDNFQDLSVDEEKLLNVLSPKTVTKSGWVWSPIVISLVIVGLVFLINMDWVRVRLQEVPYYKIALLGLLFSLTLGFILFLS